MNNKSSEDNSRTGFIIAFIVVAVLSVVCCIFVNSLIKKNGSEKETSDTSSSVTTDVSAELTSSVVTEDVNSIEILTEELASNLNEEFTFSDASVVPNTDNNKYPFSLSNVLTKGDILEKVSVTYSAEDPNSKIDKIICAFGFNVTKDGISDSNERSKSDNWFQGDQVETDPHSHEYTLEYTIPENVQEKINFEGECQAGYWYGNVPELKVTRISFFKKPYIKKFIYNKKSEIAGTSNDYFLTNAINDKVSFNLSKFSIMEHSQIQCISLKVSGDNPINNLSGSFNITESDNINIEKFTMQEEGNTAVINFFINPSAAASIDTKKSKIQFSLQNDNNEKINVDSVTVYYLTPGALKKLEAEESTD